MNLRDYLLAQKGYADSLGNSVVFSSQGLDDGDTEEAFWIFLDEGLRCGGRIAQIPCTLDEIKALLLGCKKQELWDMIEKDIILSNKHF